MSEPAEKLQIGYDGNPPKLRPVRGVSKAEVAAKLVLMRNVAHCRICRLHYEGKITASQHRAAERLQDDHELAQVSPIRNVDLELSGGAGRGPRSVRDAQIDAMRRKGAALEAVGETGRFLIERIVLEERTFAVAAFLLRWRDRKAILPALGVALDALASHYGFV